MKILKLKLAVKILTRKITTNRTNLDGQNILRHKYNKGTMKRLHHHAYDLNQPGLAGDRIVTFS